MGEDDFVERCLACDQPLEAGDLVLSDVSGDYIHVECCGPERDGYVGAGGEPLRPDEPIPEGWVWTPDDAPQVGGEADGR